MRVIFLDIDGVVNTFQLYKEPPTDIPKNELKFIEGYYVDICSSGQGRVSNIQAVTILDKLCHEFDLKIVLSSTWRLGHYDKTIEALRKSGLSEDIEIIGKTERLSSGHRGAEISKYLTEHPEIKDYIILDDDSFDLLGHGNHLFKTDTYTGLTFRDMMDIENYFKKK